MPPPHSLTGPSITDRCDLTVIIAALHPDGPLDRCIAALERACRDVPAEIVVVQTTGCLPFGGAACKLPLTILRVGGGALVPQLWARGVTAARGEYVAFTLDSCEVSDNWARAMIDALRAGAAGVGGPMDCVPEAGLVTRGLYYLRYSAFIPARVSDGEVAGDIPGDNAGYSRQAVMKHSDVIADGFWEVLFHRRLRQDDGRLCMRSAARAQFGSDVGGLRRALRHRFAHGRHFGAWRVKERIRRPWQVALVTPVVPLLLAARAASRVLGIAEHRWALLSSAPILLTLASAWAVGEAVGALCGPGLPTLTPNDEVK